MEIDEQGREVVTRLGKRCIDGEVLQHVVPAGRWFGARLAAEGSFCLVGCQVSPGFDFRDFEIEVSILHPEYQLLIQTLRAFT